MEPMITRWIILTIYRHTTNSISSYPLYIFETQHYPYELTSFRQQVLLPGADQIKVVFDHECHTLPNSDCLSFSTKDESTAFLLPSSSTKQLTPKYNFSGTHFQNFELNNLDSFYFSFDLEEREEQQQQQQQQQQHQEEVRDHRLSLEKFYGWKFSIYANFPKVNYNTSSPLLSPSYHTSTLPMSPSHPQLHGNGGSVGGGSVGVGLSEISFLNDTIPIDNLESFCFVLITKTQLSSLLSTYLQHSDDFTRRFTGHTISNLLNSPHNTSYFLHLNNYFHYFLSFYPNDSISLISLGYCYHQMMCDRYNRGKLLSSSSHQGDFLQHLKKLCCDGPIECKTYVAMCLANIAKESKENR
jgi:hypothetical protein